MCMILNLAKLSRFLMKYQACIRKPPAVRIPAHTNIIAATGVADINFHAISEKYKEQRKKTMPGHRHSWRFRVWKDYFRKKAYTGKP